MSAITTPHTFPSLISIFLRQLPKLTSPPSAVICCLIFLITTASTSVPICGLLAYRISSDAPNFTKLCKTYLILPNVSEICVLSFPSENVPAPPSPNCTLHSVSSSPVSQNCATFLVLVSTSCPRSYTTGLSPALASSRAQNIPAGPSPITTGLSSSLTFSVALTGNL